MQNDFNIRLLRATFIVVALLKLFLVADQEIFAQRFDDMGYAQSIIDHYYGCDPNLNWLFIRPIGFPLFGALCMEMGIPYRVCIELLFLAASYFFCIGLARIVRMTAVPLVCMLVLVFHPWALTGFNQLITEPFFLSLMLLLLGIYLRLIAREEWNWRTGWLWLLGPLAALMMLTRREEPWLFGTLAVVFIAHFLKLRLNRALPWKAALLPMLLILIPVGSYKAVMLGISTFNYMKWGIFATNEQEAPGFAGLLDVLYKIDTPDPSIWAPVTARTLEMAMEASPRFAQLREGMFDQNNPHLEYGESTTGRKGELGAWMWWRLYDSLASCGIYTSPREADAWMRETTRELQAALDDGRLPARSFATRFPVDPNIGIWLPEFPRLFLNTLKRLHYARPEVKFAPRETEVPSFYRRFFDQAANRRASLLADNGVEVAGHAFCADGRLDFIALENQAGAILAATAPQGTLYWKLNDIRKLTGQDSLFETAFHIQYIPRSGFPLQLSLWKDGKRLYVYPLGERPFPHHVITRASADLPVVDLTVTHFSSAFPDTGRYMRAMLRGWAFTLQGPVTHVSLVNDKGQFLKLEAFTATRDDIAPLYRQHLKAEPQGPLGFGIETPVLDLSPITVQFWKDQTLIHEMLLTDLPEGYWGTITETISGIPLVLGVGRQQLPQPVVDEPTLREATRARLITGHNLFAILAAIVLVAGNVFWRMTGPQAAQPDRWGTWAAVGVIGLFLLGRAAFYGLVEAAVVPDVNRYMDCVSPIASVLLVLLLSMLVAYTLQRLMSPANTQPATPAE